MRVKERLPKEARKTIRALLTKARGNLPDLPLAKKVSSLRRELVSNPGRASYPSRRLSIAERILRECNQIQNLERFKFKTFLPKSYSRILMDFLRNCKP